MKRNAKQGIKTLTNKAVVILTAMLITLFCCAPAHALDYTSAKYSNGAGALYVAGVPVSGSSSGSGWSYDPSTNTLTLDSYNYTGTGIFNVAIDSSEDCEVINWNDIPDADDEDGEDWDEDDEDWDEDDEDWDEDDEDWDEDDEDWDEDDEDWDEDDEDVEYVYMSTQAYVEHKGVIESDGSLTIRLNGVSRITVTDSGSNASYALNIAGNLTTEGSGTLYVTTSAGTVIYGKTPDETEPQIVWEEEPEQEVNEWHWPDGEEQEQEVNEWHWPDDPANDDNENVTEPEDKNEVKEDNGSQNNQEKNKDTESTNNIRKSPQNTTGETTDKNKTVSNEDPADTTDRGKEVSTQEENTQEEIKVADNEDTDKEDSDDPEVTEKEEEKEKGNTVSTEDKPKKPDTGDSLPTGILVALISIIVCASAALITMGCLRINGRF